MILTIGQTAKAVQLSKTSICKHIASGRLSASWNRDTNPPQREIDASEIMRVYGVDVTLPPSLRPPVDAKIPSVDTTLEMVVKAKDETIATLKAEIDRMSVQIEAKDRQLEIANRLLAAPNPVAEMLEKLEQSMRGFIATQAPPAAPPEPNPEAAANIPAPNERPARRGWWARLTGKAA